MSIYSEWFGEEMSKLVGSHESGFQDSVGQVMKYFVSTVDVVLKEGLLIASVSRVSDKEPI
ncbi:hypothetical protein AB4268_04830 [Vibrio cyclitrophicus]|uniref:hypothetical protein n=1 Tax=Vibrio cyclitrophicus TaxID=47951 RepID=UPI000C838B09|nr:hypothetical protein [Vibrio cyclitrophicus]PMK21934.1 hypothetical protein BCU04_19535 [Vibrio cyclitrophicus]